LYLCFDNLAISFIIFVVTSLNNLFVGFLLPTNTMIGIAKTATTAPTMISATAAPTIATGTTANIVAMTRIVPSGGRRAAEESNGIVEVAAAAAEAAATVARCNGIASIATKKQEANVSW
jgi:hypothetical protein